MKEQYLDSVRALLDCPQGERERLLSRLGQAVSAYLEDAPEAGEPELAANFGTPEECAARLLEECDPGAVAAKEEAAPDHRGGAGGDGGDHGIPLVKRRVCGDPAGGV